MESRYCKQREGGSSGICVERCYRFHERRTCPGDKEHRAHEERRLESERCE